MTLCKRYEDQILNLHTGLSVSLLTLILPLLPVNLEIFARILFSRKASKDIFMTLKIRNYKDMIYLNQ